MKTNKHIRAWLNLGVCRGARLAEKLNCSRQYIESASRLEKGLSQDKKQEIFMGIALVEADEAQDRKKVEQNIVRAAHLSHSTDGELKRYALVELDKWVDVLGKVAA